MKKFIFSVILLVIGAMLFEAGWSLNHNKDSGFDDSRDELSRRASKIEMLEDSVEKLNAKVELYEQLMEGFHTKDSEHLETAIHQLWNVREDKAYNEKIK